MLAAARSGDEKAFMALVTPWTSGLQRLACRYSRNNADADDICQESLLKAYLKREQFSGTQESAPHELHSWLMKITANSAIDFLRRKHTKRFVPLDECSHVHDKAHDAGTGGWGEDPERAYARREQLELLSAAITKLPVELRRVCLLRNMMELSTKEVAERLGITTTAVRLRLFRAHARLRKSLDVQSSALAGSRRADDGSDSARHHTHGANRRAKNYAKIRLRYQTTQSCAYGD
jgi:RNA polymerase sigma factor (sigma-70 family)